MSVLDTFEATPNRVRSLARLTLRLEPTSRDVLRESMMPGKDDPTQFNYLLRETVRLNLLEIDKKGVIARGPGIEEADITDDDRFLRHAEATLLGQAVETSENRSFRYALAWLLAQPSGMPIPWNSDQHLLMEQQMDGSNTYDVTNKERFAMLCYWARFLGFAASMDVGGQNVVVPDPTESIARRLDNIFADRQRIPMAEFFNRLSRELPVLEGGIIRNEIENRFREKRPISQVSVATGLALWRLEDRKTIKLDHLSDAETWVMPKSIVTVGAGAGRAISHIERGP